MCLTIFGICICTLYHPIRIWFDAFLIDMSEHGVKIVSQNRTDEAKQSTDKLASVSPRLTQDARRRRCLFRASHRGTREMDLVMGSFAEAHLTAMSDDDLHDFEQLIDVPDRDLFSWICGSETIPVHYDVPVLEQMIAFHKHSAPLYR